MTNFVNAASELERSVIDAIKAANALPEEGAPVSDALLQQLLALSVKLYVKRLEENPELSPFGENDVSATEIVTTVCQLLDYASIELFELGMWRSSRRA